MRSPRFIIDRHLKVALELCGQARPVTFVVGYAPTDTQAVGGKNAFWTALDRVVKEEPEHEQLFVLMETNAPMGRRRKKGSAMTVKGVKFSVPHARDSLNNNGERVLFSANHGLAPLDTFFSIADNATWHTFNGRGNKTR